MEKVEKGDAIQKAGGACVNVFSPYQYASARVDWGKMGPFFKLVFHSLQMLYKMKDFMIGNTF